MSLIENERTKLLANAIDRSSTACVTVGVIAPVAASFYNVSGNGVSVWAMVLGTCIWLFAAAALHLAARRALRGLKP